MAIADQESLPDTGDNLDSFVVDIERLSHVTDTDISPNSRITEEKGKSFKFQLQRNLSRKGSHRGERKNSSATEAIDTTAANGDVSSKGGGITVPIAVPMGNPAAEAMNKQGQVMMTMKNNESRTTSSSRRHGGKRPLAPLIGPRTVVVFFATLSSIGTMLLLYFVLSMGRLSEDDLSLVQPE
ncbi:hypothetical protein NE237_002488 [Protea cynaroides]|uniref:Uncharacterized protein n=1 Tax=Protea cynaroides TaxID=273540 RepID=A0A9Q0QZD9_9MAGN|nr:hypothetical protein NE237_002488 [Protea cynaroides]